MEQTKEKNLKKLTKKRKGFARDFAIEPNGTKAVLQNFNIDPKGKDPAKTASVMAVELLGIPSVVAEIEKQQTTLKAALDKQGVTPEKIALKIDELLSHEDYQAVDKGLKHATAIYGIEDEKPKSQGATYNFIFNSETQADIAAMEAKIKARMIQKHEPQEN